MPSRRWRETPAAEPDGEDGQRFRHRQARPNAGSGASAEWNVLEAVALILPAGGEALRVERVGLIPELAVAMDDPRPDGHQVTRPDLVLAQRVGRDRFPIEARDGRVKPQRFLEDRAQQR